MFELLDETEEVPDPVAPAVLPQPVAGRVAFDDVSFRYLPDKPLIEDLSLVVEPGQTVAIVGPTGAGKTTLVNLLMRFYDVDRAGSPSTGSTPASSRDDLRRTFGMVLQDTWLFKGTIRENIAYGADAGSVSRRRSAPRPRRRTSTTSCDAARRLRHGSSTTRRRACPRARSSC